MREFPTQLFLLFSTKFKHHYPTTSQFQPCSASFLSQPCSCSVSHPDAFTRGAVPQLEGDSRCRAVHCHRWCFPGSVWLSSSRDSRCIPGHSGRSRSRRPLRAYLVISPKKEWWSAACSAVFIPPLSAPFLAQLAWLCPSLSRSFSVAALVDML